MSLRKLLLSLTLLLLLVNPAYAVFEFVSKINCGSDNCSGTEDYDNLATWEAAMDDAGDITDSSTKCGLWDGQSGSDIADAASVTWDGGSSTGTLVHMTNHTGTADDMYILNVTTGTLADNDTVSDGTNTFDIAGSPDSCQITAEVYDDDGQLNDTTLVLDGLITNTTNYMKITAPSGERHNGSWDASSGVVVYGGEGISDYKALAFRDNYIVFEWMQLYGGKDWVVDVNGSYCTIQNCLITKGGVRNPHGIDVNYYVNFNLYNTVIFGMPSSTCVNVDTSNFNVQFHARNITVTGCTYGIAGEAGQVILDVKNSLIVDNTTDFYGSYNSDSDYNISSDSTAPGTNSVTNASISFVDAANDDYHLDSGDTDAIDAGTDLGTTANIDIDGRDRDSEGDTWDIGADEYVSSGSGGRTRRMFVTQ